MRSLRLPLFFIAAFFAVSSIISCIPEDEEEEAKPTSSSSGVCAGGYKKASNDVQLDSFCGQAYAFRCLDGKALSSTQVQAACKTYNSIKESSAPSCKYCN